MKTKFLFQSIAAYIFCSCFFGQTNVNAQTDSLLYGVTAWGGTSRTGSIFHIDPISGVQTLDYFFPLLNQGSTPYGDLTDGGNGKFYGMTSSSFTGRGVLFELDPVTNTYLKKIDFDGIEKGQFPLSTLALNGGKLYGTTAIGGIYNMGVIFEFDPSDDTFTKKIDFDGTYGSEPQGSLTLYQGKFYGMARSGGANNMGVIYEWDPATNIITKKIDFDGTSKGRYPVSALTAYNGKLYGMTLWGGVDDMGVIFEWDPSSNILIKKIDFDGSSLGNYPQGKLAYFSGLFYGTTNSGGTYDKGVIFQWNPVNNNIIKKIDFDGTEKGCYPLGSLTMSNNKFYGMTNSGGTLNKGVIFEWEPNTNFFIKKIDFDGRAKGSTANGSLMLSNGILYGMTSLGGEGSCGVIFELEPVSNNFTKKIDFNYTPDGSVPLGSLTSFGNKLYGLSAGNNSAYNLGTIFEWNPLTNVFTKKIDFNDTVTGRYPCGTLQQYENKLYGMTPQGGANHLGVIFEFDPVTNIFTKNIDFDGMSNGSGPFGELTLFSGKFYGMTSSGGIYNKGVIFEWDPVTNIYTKKIDFDGTTKGSVPRGSLSIKDGIFYGVTYSGGINDMGVIFEWDPINNIFIKKIDFDGPDKGKEPYCNLTLFNDKFYGMSWFGGVNDMGVIFEWDPISNIFTKKIDFDGITKGSYPRSSLTLQDGMMYGMTTSGGANECGVIFKWCPDNNAFTKLLDFNIENGSGPVYTYFTTYNIPSPIQASSIIFSNVQSSQMTINWSDGNGSKRVVFIKQDSVGTAAPINNTTYNADTAFSSGTQIGISGWYCVFNGTTHTSGVTVTNLQPNTYYRVMVCEYNGNVGNELYNSFPATGNPINQQTVRQTAPITIAPIKGVPLNSAMKIPITVIGFDSISACTLRLEYDSTVLSYTGYSNVNSQLSGMLVNDLPVSASLHKVIIVWSDIDPKTIPSNSRLLDLDFTYLSGNTTLTWNNTANGGADCEYADAVGDPLPDVPSYQYYIDGEVHWQPGYQVSGVMAYNNVSNTPMDQVEVDLMQNALPVSSAVSNTSGYYEFSVIPDGIYKAEFNCTKPWSGVNATDALKVQRHAVGLEPLTEPIRLLAADVNNSNSINATDALKIKRRVVGLDTTFARGDWTFAKPTIGGDTIIVNGANITQNFYGLCVGDVNGSNIPATGNKFIPRNVNMTHNGVIKVCPGCEFYLPVTIGAQNMVNAISLVIPYQSELIEVLGIQTQIGEPVYSAYNNEIRIAWSDLQSLSLQAGDTLILLRLRATELFVGDLTIELITTDESELADETGNVISPVELFTQSVKSFNNFGIDDQELLLQQCSIFPNPAKDIVNIELVTTQKAKLDLEITDLVGRVMVEKPLGENLPGLSKFQVNTAHLKNGIYTFRLLLQTDNHSKYYSFKVVIDK